MANDRLFLVCLHCRASTMLAKYYPGDYGVWNGEQRIGAFVNEHMGCSPAVRDSAMELANDACFEVLTEDMLSARPAPIPLPEMPK